MATIILPDVGNVFPEGSTVAAHSRDQWGGAVISGAPRGASTDTSVVSGGDVQFDGLEQNHPYVAYALVGGTPRHQLFEVVSEILTGPPGLDIYPLKDHAETGAGSFAVTTVSQLWLPSNDDRLYVDVTHDGLTDKAYIAEGVMAEVGKGIPLAPSQSKRLENFTGAYYVIANGGGCDLSYVEL